ncbi:MAG: SIR2 family protein [Candidatus Cloacimonetes bacterium]|jgi:hypothetical protein|nr:SIR2 family protein [Candidatus Cloacimonadota bacterium]MDY0172453.1 SIR2 family protein [Candidatus Cloacimonadaceae bacterium]
MPDQDDLKVIYKDYLEELHSLEDLLIQGSCVFLIGAGCSKIAGLPLMAELSEKVRENADLSARSKQILQCISEQFTEATSPNIEDYLSEIVDHLSIIDRRCNRGVNEPSLSIGDISVSSTELRTALEEIKRGIADSIQNSENEIDISFHRMFVRAIHRPSRPGKQVKKGKIAYINLNYDTLLEDALALEKIPFYDGIDGGASGWWNNEKFYSNDIGTKVLKLHGSIDWTQLDDDPLPRRIATGKLHNITNKNIMIWPASTKFRETQLDPFAQLLTLARQALKSEDQSEKVLVILGYSYSDAHINSEIDRALRNSEGSLTIIAFSSSDEPCGNLKTWFEDTSIKNQIRIYTNKGLYHGDVVKTSTVDLLWWKFENIVRLIRGEL